MAETTGVGWIYRRIELAREHIRWRDMSEQRHGEEKASVGKAI